MSFFRGDNDIPDPDRTTLPAEEDAVLEKLARKAVDRGMAVPAIIFLESIKPLNFIASQVMVFFEPVIQGLFNFKDYNTLRSALEKRESVEILLLKIEKFDAVAAARQKRIKKYMKELKKDWKWYQKYLGLFRPKFKIPQEVIEPPADSDSEPTA